MCIRDSIRTMHGRVQRAVEVALGVGDVVVELLGNRRPQVAVSYTHLRAHETVLDLVCRLLLEKKKNTYINI